MNLAIVCIGFSIVVGEDVGAAKGLPEALNNTFRPSHPRRRHPGQPRRRSPPVPPAPAPPMQPTPPPPPTPPGAISVRGRCGLAIGDNEAQKIDKGKWLDDYGDSVGFWYNWNDNTRVTLHASGNVVPFIPMWWGDRHFSQHPGSWCSGGGHTNIPNAEQGPAGVAFSWNEAQGGGSCACSMAACPGGNYGGASGATRSAGNYGGCVDAAKAANRLVSTPCVGPSFDASWLRAWHKSRPQELIDKQSQTVCCSHLYSTLYNKAGWGSCDMDAMTNVSRLTAELQSLHDDGTCDYHFIQEIGIGGCKHADHTASEKLMESLGNAVRNIPTVYLGWFANSMGAGDTSRKTTWPFEENSGTIGQAYRTMCKSLMNNSTGNAELNSAFVI